MNFLANESAGKDVLSAMTANGVVELNQCEGQQQQPIDEDQLEEEEDEVIVEGNPELQDFFNKINSKCKKYRAAVEKDQAKKDLLMNGLEKDFGSTHPISKEIENMKCELDSMNSDLAMKCDIQSTIN